MAGRGGRRGRGGARGGRSGTNSKHSMQFRSSDGAGESKTKRSKDEAVYEEFSDLLAQPAEILVKIINYLDAQSLRELAFSCQSLFDFCRETKRIHVVFPVKDICPDFGVSGISVMYRQHYIKEYRSFEEHLKQLLKWPLSIHIDKFCMCRRIPLDKMTALKAFFVENKVKKIRSFSSTNSLFTVKEVENFTTNFIKVFEIESADVESTDWSTEAVVLAYLKMPVTTLGLTLSRNHPHVDGIVNCTIPTLGMHYTPMRMADMDAILEIWKSRDGLKNWKFVAEHISTDELIDYFNCRHEVLPFDYEGPIDWTKPPVFMEEKDGDSLYFQKRIHSFYLLREDGKLICVSLDLYIKFRLCPIEQGPLPLRTL